MGCNSLWLVSIGLLTLSSLPAGAQERTSIVGHIQRAFQQKNSNIQDTTLLQVQPVYGKTKKYLVLAHGITADKRFAGSFEDELFGLFVVDDSFSRIERLIDVFPSRRWNDYAVKFKLQDAGTVIVTGQGATYGDQKVTKWYSIRSIHGLPAPRK